MGTATRSDSESGLPRSPGLAARKWLAVVAGLLLITSLGVLISQVWLDAIARPRAVGVPLNTTLVIVRPEVLSLAGALGWACFLLLVVFGLVMLSNRMRVAGLILLCGAALFPIYHASHIAWEILTWDVEGLSVGDEILHAGSGKYTLGSYGMLQGTTMCLLKWEDEGLVRARVRIVGDFATDSPRNWAPVVRLKGIMRQSILESPDGRIFVFNGMHHCYLSYDPASGLATNACPLADYVSPFELMGPNTELNKDDVETIIQETKAGQPPDTAHHPSKELLAQALQHPNPAVQQAAKRMLEAI